MEVLLSWNLINDKNRVSCHYLLCEDFTQGLGGIFTTSRHIVRHIRFRETPKREECLLTLIVGRITLNHVKCSSSCTHPTFSFLDVI